ncbi:0155594c-a37f-4981-a3fe-5f83ca72cdc4 [Sclerotinia trifoliorum]|uniref:0155594c-a37f-4981-a3fe-5f83ca72cdc4 n=2 Tax=Sclerotinia trifoliorum TaxID=28548 RepID=A0A8H2VQU1_9HELO|nr:0155594c-a37f-4981-a3fe-5f83ca72cdc4 [Sclerotinia trifoliorum]
MDIDEDDDFYAPEESAPISLNEADPAETAQHEVKSDQQEEDLEEGEEEDEGEDSDSDIDIITEKKDGAPPSKPKGANYDNLPSDLPSHTKSKTEADAKAPAVKTEKPKKSSETQAISGAELPGLAISKIDVNAKPMYEPAGKPITQINIDEDLNENDKPWRRPGTDISDYFNYGFDEFTWALYANKQESLRSEFDPNKIAQNNKKMFEDMNMMMAMGGMPGMPAGGGMPGMEGMTPEMMQQMQQMMAASGMDPSQMDPSMFGGSNPAGGAGGFGGQFGGGGFDQNLMGSGGDNSNRGGGFGRGRGRRGRGNW